MVGRLKPVFSRLWTKRSKKIALLSLGVLLGLMVIVQLAYPRDRALPRAVLGTEEVGGWTIDDMAKLSKELYAKSTVEVEGGGKTMMARSLSTVGVAVDHDWVAKEAAGYPLWARFVPTSVFWLGKTVETVDTKIEQMKLDAFVADNQSSFVIAPENAKLVVDGARVKVVDEAKGARLSPEQFKRGVESARFVMGGPTVLDVKFTYSDPAIRASDLEPLGERANKIISKGVELSFEQTAVRSEGETLASWLMFEQAEAKSVEEVTIGINRDNLLQFVHEKFDGAVARPEGVTEVYLTDGVEQSRKVGPDGRAVDEAAVEAEAVRVLLEEGSGEEVVVVAKAVPARIKNNHTFTKSQRGLQAYLNSLAEEGDIRASVSQLGRSGWSASYRGGEQTVAASTYKVYAVVYALNQIAEGKLSYRYEVGGMTLRDCMTRTIVRPDNDCPEAMLEKFGRSKVSDFFYERGYSRATDLGHSTASQTSTDDLVRVMTDIERGAILKGSERSFMIDQMKAQIYRQGIPAGTSAVAAGKVGFLWGYLNDAAIVYHPSGTYVLSVMTNNASWGKIAGITRKIEGIMY